jgi:uncharacterized C2H2 Zn-finger protein
MKGPPRVKFVQYPILSRCPVCGAPVYKGSKIFCKPSHEAKFNREKRVGAGNDLARLLLDRLMPSHEEEK